MFDSAENKLLANIEDAVNGLTLHVDNAMFIMGAELENRISEEAMLDGEHAAERAAYACRREYRVADIIHDYLEIIDRDVKNLNACIDSIYHHKKTLKQKKPE